MIITLVSVVYLDCVSLITPLTFVKLVFYVNLILANTQEFG